MFSSAVYSCTLPIIHDQYLRLSFRPSLISQPCSGSPQISQSPPPCVLTNVQCGQTRSFAPPAAKPSPCPPESRAIWSNTSGGMSSSIGACVDPEGADPAGRAACERRQWNGNSLGSKNLRIVSRVKVISVCQPSVRMRASSTVGSSRFGAVAVRTSTFMSSYARSGQRNVQSSLVVRTDDMSCVVPRKAIRCQSLNHRASATRCD